MNVAMSTVALVAEDPVFHRWNDHPHRSRFTACGCRPWGNTKYVVVLRANAVKFARACGKCWPPARVDPELAQRPPPDPAMANVVGPGVAAPEGAGNG